MRTRHEHSAQYDGGNYPDQAHDAETLLVDPITGDLVIITKEVDGNSLVFRAAGNTPADTPTELEAIGSYQLSGSGQALQVSAGDVSPTGDRIILRTYQAIYLWQRAAGTGLGPTFETEPVTIPSPTEPQGEGLAFSSDGRAWFAAGEQEMTLYRGNAGCP